MQPGRPRDARAQPRRGGALRLHGSLRPRQLHQQAQGLEDRARAHSAAADGAEAVLAVGDTAVAGGDGEMDQA